MFEERSIQYTSFNSRKQPANAGTERKQFTENASVALQQPMLTHAHTKCPPVVFFCYLCAHRQPKQSVCATDCYFTINVLDSVCFSIAIYH